MQSLLLLAHVEELLGSAGSALQSAERALTLSKRCLVARSGLLLVTRMCGLVAPTRPSGGRYIITQQQSLYTQSCIKSERIFN